MDAAQGPFLGLDDSTEIQNAIYYLESLPERYGFAQSEVPNAFSIWICDVLPSVMAFIQRARASIPISFRSDHDAMIQVSHEDQVIAKGNDTNGLMSSLANFYRKFGRLHIRNSCRGRNGLIWLKLYEEVLVLESEGIDPEPCAIIWLWPEDFHVVPDPLLCVRIAQLATAVDGQPAALTTSSSSPDRSTTRFYEREWDVLGILRSEARRKAIKEWRQKEQSKIDIELGQLEDSFGD